uniref:Uncharacterized protein n=1 Tax=Marseillevirus LCMAC201 TaxID=2506605 RepID=A0A481YVQ8_9VIRU|nr:MAG: hypothetical protein LCMAC201_01800 [Marseillevirus LCMAC201]
MKKNNKNKITMKKYELYSWIELQKHLHLILKDLQELEVGKEYDRNFDE